ncbi:MULTISPECIES: elongation factor P maturation arginine rhamnosyltransferase EarP [unclassified Caballeronia]|uniref:elongation factor P maturation arginine rhamnosyltransferase EarP n=1 Tax=unclassified Caballeronia TaxID=2646786 RepID=UPI00158908C6|nr:MULTISPECIES: elongation factor P maturation arginine rhamnosyltransferase EarP [unclassified Caballeronia]QSN60509.1 elongation factor P maturation arginine rhamnosyltransferase EarP [Caballeronia sp. M1242]
MSTASTTSPSAELACDIFCAVVDNFGDIGVCWRLARQLRAEHGWRVRLFVDDLAVFHALCPAVDASLARQEAEGVVIEHWREPAHAGDTIEIADVVVEAFACELPHAYIAAMARRERKPVWINLEYLSGEDWVADFHLRPSPHPRYPLDKTFFFPGLGAGTGGVLKERDLDTARTRFDAAAWWRERVGIARPDDGSTVVSLFAYENPAVDALLAQWRDGAAPIVLLVPEGRISGAVARFFGLPKFAAGTSARAGALQAHALGFVEQPRFDDLLWASDINFVRGEDSFVRAQWARKPFVWHIYPQADDAHLPKLDAALAHITRGLSPAAEQSISRFWHAWNGAGTPDWADFWRHRGEFESRASAWADELASVGDLAGNLVSHVTARMAP